MKLLSSSPAPQKSPPPRGRSSRLGRHLLSKIFIRSYGLVDSRGHRRDFRDHGGPYVSADDRDGPAVTEASLMDRAHLRTILATITLSVLTVTLLYDKPWSSGWTAAVLNVVSLSLFLTHILVYKDRVMARLLLFGLTFGVVELMADALCVRYTRTLDYSVAHSPMLGLSPYWMPTAWMIVAAQIGYVGSRLMVRFGTGLGMALTALLGAVNIPFYEEMAFHAHWWRYMNCRMLGHTPLYIIGAELIIGLSLGPLAAWAMHGRSTARDAIYAGLVGGLSTIWGGLIGYGLVERLL